MILVLDGGDEMRHCAVMKDALTLIEMAYALIHDTFDADDWERDPEGEVVKTKWVWAVADPNELEEPDANGECHDIQKLKDDLSQYIWLATREVEEAQKADQAQREAAEQFARQTA